MSKSRGRSVRLHGMGFLPVLSLSMRSLPDGDTGKTFSFTSVLWRVMLVGMLSVVKSGGSDVVDSVQQECLV